MFKKFKPFAGPTYFEFKDPDTGYGFVGSSKADLVQRIVSYRAQNQLPQIEELGLVIDNYLCHMSEHAHKCEDAPLKRGLLPTIKGGIAVLENLWFKITVGQEEADHRSSICTQCPHNVFPDKGAFLKWSDEIAEASVGDKRSKHHDSLGNCAVCTCPLRAKVWKPGPFKLPEDQKEKMRKVKCWQV